MELKSIFAPVMMPLLLVTLSSILSLQIAIFYAILEFGSFSFKFECTEKQFCTHDDATVGSLRQYFRFTNCDIICDIRIWQFQFQI
jgi:hypothetical protein